ncbi:copper chaperone PCu(A)C [Deltaproteobacteria bacterium IMCC39524]|nr:copper chaperone PCu(A)C [Deltaproteobacteria bacterium IMCC39524]
MKLLSRSLCFLKVFLLLYIANAGAQGITVQDAWIRGIPPSATTTAAFMTIHNTGSDDAVIKSADCDVAVTVQIHTMEQVGEIMKMKEMSELRIPANGQAILAPKGYHIMLIGLIRPIKEGETIPLSLNFTDRATVVVDAVVKKWGSMSPMSHH